MSDHLINALQQNTMAIQEATKAFAESRASMEKMMLAVKESKEVKEALKKATQKRERGRKNLEKAIPQK